MGSCDHCDNLFRLGEKILLCSDGALIHDDCKYEYALSLLMPVETTIEEVLGAA